MKKKVMKVVALVVAIVSLIAFAGCNKSLFDTTYKFDRAIICLQNGEVVEGKVMEWTDFEDADQIQVKIDGKTYLVHSSNITLIAEGKHK